MKPPEVSHFRGLHHIDCDFAFSNESAWNHSHSMVAGGLEVQSSTTRLI